MALTARQNRFVQEYLVDLNAARAATRAGYGAKSAYTCGPRLLKLPAVAEAVAEGMAARAERTGVTADRVLGEYARLAFSDIRRAVSWRTFEPEEGEAARRKTAVSEIVVLDSAQMDEETSAAVAEISQAAGGAVRVKMHDKKGALDSLARHLGLFDGRGEAGGKGDPRADGGDEMVDRMAALTSAQRQAIREAIEAIVNS